jgi:hypothetical protein
MTRIAIPKLPVEIMDKIVLTTGDARVAHALRDKISQYALNRIEKNILVYGDVQGGKTNEILKYIKKTYETKVLIIQNSLLVLNQYEQRLKSEKIDYQIIHKDTTEITKNVVLILNNRYRYSYFSNFEKDMKYILMLDESDQTINACPLKNSKNVYKTVHITATPFNKMHYDRCIKVPKNANYYGINDLNVDFNYIENDDEYIENFLEESEGIMLINKYSYVAQMTDCAKTISKKFKNIPIVLLTSERKLYLHNNTFTKDFDRQRGFKKIKHKSISKIIDSLKDHKHIIFIANRLSYRGLSYVSSDYSRHLTWQITNVNSSVTNFLQSLRILGIYKSKTPLNLRLIISDKSDKLFNKHLRFIENFDIEKKMVYNNQPQL